MGIRRWRRGWIVGLAPLALLLVMLSASLSGVGVGGVSAAARNSCVGPVAGQHIYDCANLLTPAEVATLEQDATAVDKAGAPTVVFLQAHDADAEQTLNDARDLMNRWNVESKPGAHDGFVMFFNLKPGNLRHGEFAIAAGERHFQHGNLPQAELDRIRDDVMIPLLQDGQTAAGIEAGLQQVTHDLVYGPPPPPQSQVVAAFLGRIPFNILALLFAGVVALFALRVRRQTPPSTAGDGVHIDLLALAEQEQLSPALAGALIKGRVSDDQMEATVLDFGRRGLLAIEPTGKNTVQMRLLGDEKGLTPFEESVWNVLVAESDTHDKTLTSHDLAEARTRWGWSKTLLRRDLAEQGWYDPQAAAKRRRPLYIAGAIGLVGVVIAVILMALAKEGWAAIGLALFAVASIAAFIAGYSVPETTVEGEIAAAPWRGYRESVADRAYQPNLDTDLPYVVGMGLLGKLSSRLKAASERGYSPSWFRAAATDSSGASNHYVSGMGFYPYWLVFHSSMAPASSGGSGGSFSGGFSGGGAAGGGGGSAGSF